MKSKVVILLLCCLPIGCLRAKKSPFDIQNPTIFLASIFLSTSASNIEITLPTPSALFPINGNNWNDYVVRDYTKELLLQADIACDSSSASITNYFSCIHAGEVRAFEIPGRTICGNLTATDNATATGGAFNWKCGIKDNKVYVYSTGLRNGDLGDIANNPPPGLSSLIDWTVSPPTFKQISVTVSDGSNVSYKTIPAVWWQNTFSHNITSTIALSTSGTIYTFGSSSADFDMHPFSDYRITGSKVSVVIYPGKRMYKSVAGGSRIIQTVGTFSYNWVEGRFDAINHSNGIFTTANNNFFVLRNAEITNAIGSNGVEISSPISYLKNIQVANTIDPSFSGIKISSNKNVLENISTYNGGNTGLDLTNASSNLIINSLSSSNTGTGISVGTNSMNNFFSNMTTTLNAGFGVFAGDVGANGNYMQSLLITNNHSTFPGFTCVTGNLEFTLLNLVATNNNSTAGSIQFNSSGGLGPNSKRYMGFLKTSGVCSGGGNPVDGHTATGCNPMGLSDFSMQSIDFTSTNSFSNGNPKVSSESINSSFSSGTAVYNSGLRFTGFQNYFRTMGKDNSTNFPNTNLLNICSGVSNCRIYDWSLSASDTNTRNIVSCPQLLARPTLFQNSQIILRNAYEIIGDWKGDDDGFCESNEDCIYTPNVGVYQGHGNLISASVANSYYPSAANQCADIVSIAGSASDGGGSLSNIKLYKFEKNGY